ncbi:hypothetical protein ACSS6W_005910 [Trichoderma asperelloides]
MQVKMLFSAFIGLIQLSNALPTGEVEGRWLLIGGSTCAPKCIEGTEATS